MNKDIWKIITINIDKEIQMQFLSKWIDYVDEEFIIILNQSLSRPTSVFRSWMEGFKTSC